MVTFDYDRYCWSNKFLNDFRKLTGILDMSRQELCDAYTHLGIYKIPSTNFYRTAEIKKVLYSSSKRNKLATFVRNKRARDNGQTVTEEPLQPIRKDVHPVMVRGRGGRTPDVVERPRKDPYDEPIEDETPLDSRMEYVSRKNLEDDEVYY